MHSYIVMRVSRQAGESPLRYALSTCCLKNSIIIIAMKEGAVKRLFQKRAEKRPKNAGAQRPRRLQRV
ncbi:hypothetical protein [Candidatus Allofournierella merdipullorum]|uniref:hypothetical protein n=1 Tax=Candidatus Allofournierella merdipullorum TaxID=2838595 RepID=UPI00374F77D0